MFFPSKRVSQAHHLRSSPLKLLSETVRCRTMALREAREYTLLPQHTIVTASLGSNYTAPLYPTNLGRWGLGDKLAEGYNFALECGKDPNLWWRYASSPRCVCVL